MTIYQFGNSKLYQIEKKPNMIDTSASFKVFISQNIQTGSNFPEHNWNIVNFVPANIYRKIEEEKVLTRKMQKNQ